MFRPLLAAAVLTILLAAPAPAWAQPAEALKMEGRTTLYQQVITRVGARLLEVPSSDAEEGVDELEPFTKFYVYERLGEWLRVGSAPRTGPSGWIRENTAIDWKSTIVVAFNNPASYDRERTLLFRSREDMHNTIHREDVSAQVVALRAEAAAGNFSETSPVVSIEPEMHQDIDRSFYLLPIINAERQILHHGIRGRYLEIASVTEREDAAREDQVDLDGDFRAGIVFVIDTTLTMGPYIERTRRAVEQIRTRIEQSAIAENVRFGLVGYRKSLTVAPLVEYHTRVYVPLNQEATAGNFTEVIANMRASANPTPNFNEDAVGGLRAAVESSDWRPFGARFVVMISDAGPLAPTEEGNIYGMMPDQVNAYLKETHGIVPIVLHLKTPAGRLNHAYAEGAFRAMARTAQGSSYYAIADGDVDAFQAALDGIASQIVELTQQSMEGLVSAPAEGDTSPEASLRREWRAMQLSYLGAASRQQAPDVFRAWMIDRSLDDPGVEALDVRILLTRNQLATLRDVARSIVDRAEGGLQRLDPRSFFTQLREAVAVLARDPDRLARTDFETLGDALGEYLSDLPYDSPIISISEEDWLRRSGPQQRALLETLRSKIALYERIYETPEKWVRLNDDAPDGERVTTLPLRQMP